MKKRRRKLKRLKLAPSWESKSIRAAIAESTTAVTDHGAMMESGESDIEAEHLQTVIGGVDIETVGIGVAVTTTTHGEAKTHGEVSRIATTTTTDHEIMIRIVVVKIETIAAATEDGNNGAMAKVIQEGVELALLARMTRRYGLEYRKMIPLVFLAI